MMEIGAIAPLGLSTAAPAITQSELAPAQPSVATMGQSFGAMLSSGIDAVNAKMAHANDMVRQFALDDNVPVHRVTFALEEARLSLELAMQVRQRLVESYRELMNMQL